MKRELAVNLGNLLLSLSEIMDIANPSIKQHQLRTAFIAWELAKIANLPKQALEDIFATALLHDIGAISIEEKAQVHDLITTDLDLHCIRGEILFKQTPWLSPLAKIIRHHHRNWSDWDRPFSDPKVLASQIILLADYIERLIDRQKYILHQRDDIVGQVKQLSDITINRELINIFSELAGKEEFWLDLMSPRLYHTLAHQGPFWNIQIDLDGVSSIADLCVSIIDFKSDFTATHTSGVAACAERMAILFGLTDLEVSMIRIAGKLHDVGKMVIPNSILDKPGKLTPEEYAVMKSHTYYTYYVINSIEGLQPIARWAAYHHEKLDGSGYPFHCKANEIDTGARILTVADIFTATAEDRPYRAGMSKDQIYRVFKHQSDNGLIDPRFVNLLFDNYETVYDYVREKQLLAKAFYDQRFRRAKR